MTIVTLRQGTLDHRAVMNTPARRSPVDRDRAVARLRRITIGTSIASLAAVGGFGAIAALSDDGTSADLTTAAAVTAGGGATTDSAAAAAEAAAPAATTTTTTTTTTVQATAAPTAAAATAHATTGSS
jgi:hypothetical protein